MTNFISVRGSSVTCLVYDFGAARCMGAPPLPSGFDLEVDMRPSYRSGVNKRKSSSAFRRQSQRTKAVNMRGPMRGGLRL